MKKPDNIVYNNTLEEYDAFKKKYPTSFSAKNFELEEIENLQRQAKPYFSQKFLEIKKKYQQLLTELEWNQLIFEADCNFNTIIGEEYHLYENKERTFLSLVKPTEWKIKYLGTFIKRSNNTWIKK